MLIILIIASTLIVGEEFKYKLDLEDTAKAIERKDKR